MCNVPSFSISLSLALPPFHSPNGNDFIQRHKTENVAITLPNCSHQQWKMMFQKCTTVKMGPIHWNEIQNTHPPLKCIWDLYLLHVFNSVLCRHMQILFVLRARCRSVSIYTRCDRMWQHYRCKVLSQTIDRKISEINLNNYTFMFTIKTLRKLHAALIALTVCAASFNFDYKY